MSILEWLNFIMDMLADESKHFVLSAFLGSLGFVLTWTKLSAFFYGLELLTRRRASTEVGLGILISSIAVGIGFALAGHWLLDYWQYIYTTPLNPPPNPHRPGA